MKDIVIVPWDVLALDDLAPRPDRLSLQVGRPPFDPSSVLYRVGA
jgi:hypothetical protein